MASNPDNSDEFVRLRMSQLVAAYPESPLLGDCDCTSYSFLLSSIILLTLGTGVTVTALGGPEHHLLSNLGPMWLIGPLCICCGTMIAIKSLLYLRRKSVIKGLLQQRALLTELHELAEQIRNRESRRVREAPSTLTLPPAYDLLVPPDGEGASEPPPPSYAEAVLLMEHEKPNQSTDSQEEQEREEVVGKQTVHDIR